MTVQEKGFNIHELKNVPTNSLYVFTFAMLSIVTNLLLDMKLFWEGKTSN